MRYSKFFGKTRYDAPCDAGSVNARLLTQAGFAEKMAAGIYNILPLGQRVMKKIHGIIREEMDGISGQELLLPSLQPIDLWETTGRTVTMDDVLYRTKGAGDKDFVFGPSHEEAVTPLAAKYVQSYKDLPLSVYQIQTKFRDEPRAKSGLLRGREFGMKDMYSFHTSEEDLDAYYDTVSDAYLRVFSRCGLKAHVIEASGGAFSDKYSHEFSIETPAGEDTIIICDDCGTAQNLEVAEGKVADPSEKEEALKEMERVSMVRGFSVDDNAIAHGVPAYKILKTVVYEVDSGGLLGVVIRGDFSVSGSKLERYLKKSVRPASPETLKKVGLVQGFISPVNVPEEIGISFIADHSIANIRNFVTGANELNFDLINVNQGRDFIIADSVDLVEVSSGFLCTKCNKTLTEIKAVEAGNIFKLGTKFSEAFGLNYTDNEGKVNPVVMGCYGIGTTRLMGTVVEASHDDNGIIWPISVAPYHVHLISLGEDETAEKLYSKLNKSGVEVLFDDRDERAGVKFKDADLIGIPLRVVVSKRTLESDSVEIKSRSEKDGKEVKIKDALKEIENFLK